jgi:hypothetical protein
MVIKMEKTKIGNKDFVSSLLVRDAIILKSAGKIRKVRCHDLDGSRPNPSLVGATMTATTISKKYS